MDKGEEAVPEVSAKTTRYIGKRGMQERTTLVNTRTAARQPAASTYLDITVAQLTKHLKSTGMTQLDMLASIGTVTREPIASLS